MMPLSLFDIAGRAMSAQLVRLNTTASNLANAGAVAGTAAAAYRSTSPVFATAIDGAARATVDVNQELVEMLSAARQYQNNVEVIGTAKALMLDTLRLGR